MSPLVHGFVKFIYYTFMCLTADLIACILSPVPVLTLELHVMLENTAWCNMLHGELIFSNF